MIPQREVKVRLLGEAILQYNELKSKGDKQSKILLNSIEKIKERLKLNPQYGDPIRKNMIPKEYKKYGNIYRVELSNFYRLLYTIKGNEVDIFVFILTIVNHKKYNKKFGYK